MEDGKLYLCHLIGGELVLGEFNENNLDNCVMLMTKMNKAESVDIIFNTPFAMFGDRDLYSIDNIKSKVTFNKALGELDQLSKNYYDWRLQRFSIGS